MKIQKMTDELFAQRRRVIQSLYEARLVLKCKLPRIKVRIVEFGPADKNTLGKCFIDKDYITISHELVDWNSEFLRHVVWHELGHAYFNAKHNDKCPLMSPTIGKPANKTILSRALVQLRKKELL